MNPKVFLVDDDIIFLEMLKDTMNDMALQADFVLFRTGEDALLNMHLRPAIVVLDHILNTKDHEARYGLEVLRDIQRASPSTKVVIISMQEDRDVMYSFIAQFAAEYIVKDHLVFERVKKVISQLLSK